MIKVKKLKIEYEKMTVKCKNIQKFIEEAEKEFLTPDQRYELEHEIELLAGRAVNVTGKALDKKTENTIRLNFLIRHGAKIDLKRLER
jgi:hypothetical protein